MRVWVLVALAGTLALAGWAIPPSVLPNGGFEDGLTGWTVTADAAGQASGAAGTADVAQPLAGAKALKLSLPGKGTVSATSAKAPVAASADVLITLRYRSEGFSAPGKADISAYAMLNWLDAQGKPLPVTYLNGIPLQAQAKWSGISRLIAAPAGAAGVQLSLIATSQQGSAPSAIWFDQVQVRPWDGAVKPGGKSWRYIPAIEGLYDGRQFRAVADDTTKSGLAVIANPKFVKQGGYLSAFLYLRNFKPGAYRITYRLKVAAPPPDGPVVTLSSEANIGGTANSRVIRGAEFAAAGAWQTFSMRFVIAPWSEFTGFGAVWAGNTTMSLDTITVEEEEIYTDAQAAELFN